MRGEHRRRRAEGDHHKRPPPPARLLAAPPRTAGRALRFAPAARMGRGPYRLLLLLPRGITAPLGRGN